TVDSSLGPGRTPDGQRRQKIFAVALRSAGSAKPANQWCTSGRIAVLSVLSEADTEAMAGISGFDLGRNSRCEAGKTILAAADLDRKPAKCFFWAPLATCCTSVSKRKKS